MPRAILLLLGLWLAAGSANAQAWKDDFDAQTLDPRWTWRTPVQGPTFSLTDRPGWLRITIPMWNDPNAKNGTGFNHWNQPPVDTAPQLRAAAPQGDFDVETHIQLQKFGEYSHFQVGLLVGMSDQMLLAWGLLQGPGLPNGPKTPECWFEPTGTSGCFKVKGDYRDVVLRLTRQGNTYRAAMRAGQDDWVRSGIATFADPPKFVGIIGKTFAPAPQPGVTFDVDYVRIGPVGSLDEQPDPVAPPPTVAPVAATNPSPPVAPTPPGATPPAANPPVVITPAPPVLIRGPLESPDHPRAVSPPSPDGKPKTTPQMLALGKRLCDRGERYLKQKEYEKAAACFRMVLQALPNSARAKAGLAKATAGG